MKPPSSVVPAESLGFDYARVDDDTADRLRQAASEIRSAQRNVAISIIEIGVNLLEVKACIEHGQFSPWLEKEFRWSERTAQSYMRVARRFQTKAETVSVLPARLIYRLAAPSTPDQVREKVLADLEAGKHVDIRAVVLEIKQALLDRHLAERPTKIEQAAQEAQEILAKLGVGDRCKLLQILAIPGVLGRLNQVSPKPNQESVVALSEGYPDLPAFLDRRSNKAAS